MSEFSVSFVINKEQGHTDFTLHGRPLSSVPDVFLKGTPPIVLWRAYLAACEGIKDHQTLSPTEKLALNDRAYFGAGLYQKPEANL